MKPLEKEVQRSIMDYLAMIGAYRVRINSGAVVGEYKGKRRFLRFNSGDGTPDILACVNGRMVGIEVKRPGGKPTWAQLAALESIRDAGGIAFVADSIAEVQKQLKQAGVIR